jgi:Na+/H+ antiporter NhaA
MKRKIRPLAGCLAVTGLVILPALVLAVAAGWTGRQGLALAASVWVALGIGVLLLIGGDDSG